jgi:chromosome segregation ATPase
MSLVLDASSVRTLVELAGVALAGMGGVKAWAKIQREEAARKAAETRAAEANAAAKEAAGREADARQAISREEMQERVTTGLISRLEDRLQHAEEEVKDCNADRRALREEMSHHHTETMARIRLAEERMLKAENKAAQYDAMLMEKLGQNVRLESFIERLVETTIQSEMNTKKEEAPAP